MLNSAHQKLLTKLLTILLVIIKKHPTHQQYKTYQTNKGIYKYNIKIKTKTTQN